MLHTPWRLPAIVIVSLATSVAPALADAPPAATRIGLTQSEQARAKAIADKAIAYLRTTQSKETGGWSVNPKGPSFPAITGLVVTGLLDADLPPSDPAVASGIKFMLNKVQPDGGIYDQLLPSYNTAICVTALAKVPNDPAVRETVQKGAEFLKSIQYGEGAVEYPGMGESAKKLTAEHPYYGGWGYGRHGRPDLSNSGFAIEALHAAGVEAGDPAMKRALVFLRRIQMLEKLPDGSTHNESAYAKGSTQGGFAYATSVNKDNVGVGQSFAGEVVESLSEGPGTATTITLKKGTDGKPMTLKRDEIRERVAKQFKASAWGSIPKPDEFVIVLGQTSDGVSANVFTIRAPIPDAENARRYVAVPFEDVADPASPPTIEKVQQWKGVSRLRSYGSMTYVGFKSMIYAGLSKDDPRVQAALAWSERNFTLDENPGMGTDGYYYYLLMMARALEASGRDTIAGKRWAAELLAKLESLQNPDGSFRSIDDRWMEDNKDLITAYALNALQTILN